MHPEAVMLFKTAKKFHGDLYQMMGKLRRDAATTPTTKQGMGNLADMSYALKQTVKLCEDTRKELNQVIEAIEKVCCVIHTQIQEPGPIKTEFVSATPKVKMSASLPHPIRNKEKFEALMKALNIEDRLWNVPEGEKPAIALNFLGFSELISSYLREGKPLPPGIEQETMFPIFSLIIRPRKEVDAT
jgi:hypothetical protein